MSTPGFAIPAAAWSLATEFGIIGVCVAALLWRLAAPKTPFHVYITVWLSWSFALALVALVPLDLNLVYLERCLDHFGNNTRASAIACPLEHWRFSPPPPPPHPHPPQPPQTPQPPLPPQPGEDVDDEDAREPPSHEDDLLVVQQWKDLLHGLWLTVYAVTMAHGWVILNFQSAFNESRQFTVFKRFQQCFRDNVILVCIASACNIIALAVIIVLNLDLYYIIYGMMAVTNAICLVVVAFLVGFGCAVVPRALWHASHLDKSLRKCMREVASLDVKYNESATDLAAKMVAVYQLRRAAASSRIVGRGN
ncbi:hypothetical protein T484DRAFT_2371805 [Baffinella frigidus]|nr:hypothetical protein T484DRAFT_2371805 [Cryptophyta sp. CCMP2293]